MLLGKASVSAMDDVRITTLFCVNKFNGMVDALEYNNTVDVPTVIILTLINTI